MVIYLLERVTPGLRGELTRWMLEPKTGTFVGNLSAMVRERLWEYIVKKSGNGAAIMIFSADTEQGFTIRSAGDTSRTIVDLEGLQLVKILERRKNT